MNGIKEEDIQILIKKKRLSFPKNLEHLFDSDYYSKSLNIIRIALLLGIVLYSSFGLLDKFIAASVKNYIWFIRYVIVSPFLLLCFILSFFKFFKKIFQPAIFTASIIAGLGIVAMIAISADAESGMYYYAGLMLVLMWSYTLVRLRFTYATIACWIIVISYEITSIWIQGMLGSSKLIIIFINNNFFFISSNIIGMVACYYIEQYIRKDFLQRLLISEKQKVIVQEKDKLEERNDILEQELAMARTIQQQLIPDSYPSENMYSLFKPMEPVGGDLYDFIKFRDPGKIGIFISDVSGHGVPAAFITSMVKSFLLQAGSDRDDPARLISHINDFVVNQTADNFITAFYGIVDYKEKTMTYCNAGHNPPYVISEGNVRNIGIKSSLPLAVFCNSELAEYNKPYTNYTEKLASGERIIFYTDGLTDVSKENNKKERFEKGIKEILLKMFSQTCKDFINNLYRELAEYRGNENFDDDICIICLDIPEGPTP